MTAHSLAQPRPLSISMEFFPPATPAAAEQLWAEIQAVLPLAPEFVSVTYGAGGTTRDHTHSLVTRLRQETPLTPAAHLTCVGSSREEIQAIARRYWDSGIRHLVALRGDKPKDQTHYAPHAEGYAYADELVAGLRSVADFEISVAAYPETHPEAPSQQADIDHLKRKLDAGATRAITQYFFDNEVFLRFRDRLAACGIDAPVIPGILPVSNYSQVVRFSAMCGATIPDWLHTKFENVTAPQMMHEIGLELATTQCMALRAEGIDHLHFYTLNRSAMVLNICNALGG